MGVKSHMAPLKRVASASMASPDSLPAMGCPARKAALFGALKRVLARSQISSLVLPTSVIELARAGDACELLHPVLDGKDGHGEDDDVGLAGKLKRTPLVSGGAVDGSHLAGGTELERALVPAVDAAGEAGERRARPVGHRSDPFR